jgi:phospholipid-binding lipoprotein MlaA
MKYSRRLAVTSALTALLALGACSTVPNDHSQPADVAAVNDPFEPVNRVVFDVNDFLDRLLVRPLAELYRGLIPPPVRDRIAGIVHNMGEPVTFVNNVLQGEFTSAGITLGRLVVNSTAGVAGSFEVANDVGLLKQQGDFGQTLYTWGITNGGPYLVLPLLGPSNLRDAVGMGVDSYADPWHYVAQAGGNAIRDRYDIAYTVGAGIVKREENIEGMDALREGSLDFYAQMRSVFLQYRAKQLGAAPTDTAPLFEDPETTAK